MAEPRGSALLNSWFELGLFSCFFLRPSLLYGRHALVGGLELVTGGRPERQECMAEPRGSALLNSWFELLVGLFSCFFYVRVYFTVDMR